VQAHRVAVWDVYHACRREGALDSAIRDADGNALERMLGEAPRIRAILFNGKTAARFASTLADRGLAIHFLPSSSPAYTLPYAEKLRCWRDAIHSCTTNTTG
jgi:hypoxanthine-DNA glycosylase